MIIVSLSGGHSNQLFQYAVARNLAIKSKTELGIDLDRLSKRYDTEVAREYEIGVYNLKAAVINHADVHIESQNVIKRSIQHLLYRDKVYQYRTDVASFTDKSIKEHVPGQYSADILKPARAIYLEGEFQNEKYFKDIRPQLLEDLQYKTKPNKQNSELLKDIMSRDNTVSIHVRRGDYVDHPNASKFHVTTKLDYYGRAITLMARKLGKPYFYVFSDDPIWCKKNLYSKFPMHFVDINKNGSDDMRLMRSCQHNIMANSSFSWWGAWLNENPKKIIIAPKKWFGDSVLGADSIIPKDWIRL